MQNKTLPLAELGELNTGYALRQGVEPEPDGEHPLIQLGNVQDGYVDLENLPRMTMAEKVDKTQKPLAAVRAYHRVHPGDILLRSRGATYGAAKVRVVPPDAIALAPLFIMRVKPHLILDDYLVWYINREATQAQLKSQQGGTHIPSVSLQSFQELEIVVPPLEIQRRIAEINQLARQEREIAQQLQEMRDRYIAGSLEKLLNA